MAITASGLYLETFMNALDDSNITVDLSHDTNNKIALFNNSITPNFVSDTYYSASPYTSNEVTGTGWSAGGVALGTVTLTNQDSGGAGLKFDADNVSQASTTLSNAQGGLIYYNGTQSFCVCLVNFGGPYSTNNGTFAITWATTGIFTIDLTP